MRVRNIFLMLFLVTGIFGNACPMVGELASQLKGLSFGFYELYDNPVWDTQSLELELSVQHYNVLMPKMYWFFANKKESVVIDWVTKMSEQGHAAAMELAAALPEAERSLIQRAIG